MITLDKPWQSRQQALSNWVNMAANFILKCIHQMCVVILNDTSCYMLRCRPEILSRTAPCIQSSFTKRILIYLKQNACLQRDACPAHLSMHVWIYMRDLVCMSVCVCGGVTFQQLACPGPSSECEESSAPKRVWVCLCCFSLTFAVE